MHPTKSFPIDRGRFGVNIDRTEVYRYLGYRGAQPDQAVEQLVQSCMEELMEAVDPKWVSARFPLKIDGDRLDLTCFHTRSHDLVRCLSGCDEVWLFAATLGPRVDRLLQKYGKVCVSRAVVLQAVATAAIEAYCDEKNEELRIRTQAQGKYLRPRFSPGYGDLALECQRALTLVLDTPRTIGLTLSDHLIMVPSKSVTAVIGVSREPRPVRSGCDRCTQKTDCVYRKDRR